MAAKLTSSINRYGDLRKGLVVFTRDGRKFGNAIIIDINLIVESDDPNLAGTALITLESDFGNIYSLYSGAIDNFFFIVPQRVQDISIWRKSKIRNSVENI
jgi:hypothetical protein